MAPNASADKLEDTQVQIDRLRAQVEALTRDQVTPAVAEFAGRAQVAASTATEVLRNQAQALTDQIKVWPLTAVLIAAAIGVVIGRVTR